MSTCCRSGPRPGLSELCRVPGEASGVQDAAGGQHVFLGPPPDAGFILQPCGFLSGSKTRISGSPGFRHWEVLVQRHAISLVHEN